MKVVSGKIKNVWGGFDTTLANPWLNILTNSVYLLNRVISNKLL